MKKIIIISLFTFLAISLFANNALAKEKKNEKTLTYKVSMDCHNCVNKIQSNIPYEKGVKDLTVSLDDKECTVTFRTDKTDEKKIEKAFNELGYTAEVKVEKKAESTEKQAQEGHKHN